MVRGLRLQIETVANQLTWSWIIQVGLMDHKGPLMWKRETAEAVRESVRC